jgi:hypothetical protein
MDPLFAILDCAETNSLEVGNMFFYKMAWTNVYIRV